MIRFILNVLWFILGGWISGLLWLLGGLLLAVTIVGLPYTGAAVSNAWELNVAMLGVLRNRYC